MKCSIAHLTLYGVLLLFVCIVSAQELPGKYEKRPYTILTYMAGDNDLEPYIQFDLFEMKQGAHDVCHVLAFVSTNRPGEGKISKRLVLTKNDVYQDGPTLHELDSGHPSTAIAAGLWALEQYPSDNFVFIVWDHGTGPLNRVLGDIVKPWNFFADPYEREEVKLHYQRSGHDNWQREPRGVCYDHSTGNFFNDFDLRAIASDLAAHFGRKIDIFAFDACLMGDIEIAYMLMPYADYFVASQEVISRTGFEYKLMLNGLRDGVLTPRQFAHHMIESFGNWYSLTSDNYTLSAIDLNQLGAVVDNINELSEQLSRCLAQQSHHEIDRIITAAGFSDPYIRFLEPDFIDLYSFYVNLWHKSSGMPIESVLLHELQQTLLRGMAALERVVIARVNSPQYLAIRGLSIYLPRHIHPSYKQLYWCIKTKWCSFLASYIESISNIMPSVS